MGLLNGPSSAFFVKVSGAEEHANSLGSYRLQAPYRSKAGCTLATGVQYESCDNCYPK